MRSSDPVVWIGLDALELDELHTRLAQGSMPNIARLAGGREPLSFEPDVPGFAGGIWRSFINGRPVGEHGWYFRKVWRPETGRVEAAAPSWLRLEPFWQEFANRGMRLGLFDVPQAPDPGEDFPGAFVGGWQTHDADPLCARPAGLLAEMTESFGDRLMPAELYGTQTAAGLLAMHEKVIQATRQAAAICEWLQRRERFDLFMVVLGAAHRIGHYLWDLSQIDREGLDPELTARLETAQDEMYRECDEAVGRIAAAAPRGARVSVFALHGMGPNPGWTEVFPDILSLVTGTSGAPSSTGLRGHLHRLRRQPWVMQTTRLMPESAQRLVTSVWSSNMHDWSRTRYFALPAEIGAGVRINLIGREPAGIVQPGQEYEDLCTELAERLRSLRDLETDEPLAANVHITDQLTGTNGPFRRYLPDVVVDWRERRITDSPGVRMPGGGELNWGKGRRIASGRSGNHRPNGWIIGDRPSLSGPPLRTALDLVERLRATLGASRVRGEPYRALGLWLAAMFLPMAFS
jgi:predicted AlkP superfamily phosphohydrolase/phosphomutase